MNQSKKLIVFSIENGEIFQQDAQKICWLKLCIKKLTIDIRK